MRLLPCCYDVSVHHISPILYIVDLSVFIKIFLRHIWLSFCNPVSGAERFCLQRFGSARLHTNLLAEEPVAAQHLSTPVELRAASAAHAETPRWHQRLSLRRHVKAVCCLVDSTCTVLPQSLLVCCLRLCHVECCCTATGYGISPCSSLHNFSVSSWLIKQLSHCKSRFPVSTRN